MTGKTLRANLLIASNAALIAGAILLTQPSDPSHASHVVAAILIAAGVMAAFVREQVKEDQLTKVFVQKKDLDCEEKPPNP